MFESGRGTRRSFLVGGLTLSALAALQAGCQGSAPSAAPTAPAAPTSASSAAAPATSAPAASGATVTLKLAPKATGATMPPTDVKTVTMFQQKYPNLKVTLDVPPSGNYYEKILTEIAAGDPPDAARIDDYLLAPTAARKGIDPLDPYIKADSSFGLDDFNTVALQNGQYEGQQYGIPIELDCYVIFYNADAFKEVGAPLPPSDWNDASWTWPTFLDACQKLVKQSGATVQRWGFMWDFAFISRLSAEIYALGGTFVDDPAKPTKLTLNNPKSVAGLQFLADLRNKYHVSPLPGDLVDTGGNQGLFQSGRLAMYLDGPWSAAGNKPSIKTKFAWDVAAVPHQPGEKPGDTAISNCLTILAGGKQKDDAWKAVSFWTSTDVQKLHTTIPDETPSRKSALAAVKDVPPPPKNMSVFIDGQGVSIPIMHTPVYDQMQQAILSGMDLVWTGKKTAQQGVDEITPKVDALLQGKS